MASFQGNNADDPNAPEYGKKWKEEFNHGCCTACGKPTPKICTTIASTYTRADRSESRLTTTEHINDCPCQGSKPLATPCSGEVRNNNECSGC